MKKTKSVNNLMISTSNEERNGKFKNIMNSPNIGKQQIILQSCCFFDYEKCQTPKETSHTLTFLNHNKNKRNSSEVHERNKKMSYKNKSNMDLIKSKFDEMRKNEVTKLKSENKVLKDTINNLILQLDKTFQIAENVKHKEKNITQKNIFNENEMINMKNTIKSLIYEKHLLLNHIKNQEKSIDNYRRNSYTSFQSPKFGLKRNISFTNYGYNKIKDKNLCLEEKIFIEEEGKDNYKEKIYCLNEEKNKMNEENIIKKGLQKVNQENLALYDKRFNKRKYIFNKKKSIIEKPLMKSRNMFEKNELANNYNNFRESFENLIKESKELKINCSGLLNEFDSTKCKNNTEDVSFINDNSSINMNTNNNIHYEERKEEKKIKELEKINFELKLKIKEIEKKEKDKYDLLMINYNKLYSELSSLRTEFNKQIKNKEIKIEEIDNKYNNLMKEYNIKNSSFNNLKAKYDQLSRINNNNIIMMNTNRIKLNEIIIENSEIKNNLRKKTDEIMQKNLEIGRFKKLVNDLNELKNMEKKLKQNNISKENKENIIEELIDNKNKDKNLNNDSLINEIENYKLQINKLKKEKEELQKRNEDLNKNKIKTTFNINNMENNNEFLEEYKIKINKLEEKNKKMEKSLIKANQELDQYEIESKEADIEIKSFKNKMNELMNEIKKLKHKETIEEVMEENYEEEEDKKDNN